VEERPSLRILQVCSSLAWGGTEMHVPLLAEKLISRGHTVHALVHPDGAISDETILRAIPTQTISIGAYFNPLSSYRLIHFLRWFKPDIVHLHLSRDLWQMVPAFRIARHGKIILTKHVGSYVRKFDPLHTWLYRHVARIITVSDILNRNVIDTCPVEPGRVTTIHHALDMTRYQRDEYDGENTRRELNIPTDHFVIGTVGRISPGKGVEDFLTAAREICNRLHDKKMMFLIVGSASFGEEAYFKEIKQKAQSLGLGKTVLFAGFRKDVPALLNAMDLFIFPSRAEGFGATLIEAMAMQVACVSTWSDGTLDTIEEGKTGLTYSPGDVDGLTDAVMTLIQDAPLRRRIAETGQAHVRSHFDLDIMTQRVEQVYTEELGF